MHPLILNIFARKFSLSDKKRSRKYVWCRSTHQHICVFFYSNSRQMAPPSIHTDSQNSNLLQLDWLSRPTEHFSQTDNKGACSNIVAYLLVQFFYFFMFLSAKEANKHIYTVSQICSTPKSWQ